MSHLAPRPWVPGDEFIRATADGFAGLDLDGRYRALIEAVSWNRRIHERQCVSLNPATNVMNPAAESLLGAGLGSRPSLGYPGDKYEMGLEAIEQIEIYAAELACEVFGARHAEIRVASGAMANLYAFMACCAPGDTIVVPPAGIGGHVTHHAAGAAGLYGLNIVEAPIDVDAYSIDCDALESLVKRVQPRLISVGGSLNLTHHPVAEIRRIADGVGARLLFDAAHLSGVIAGGQWPDPLDAGAHLMTMSTYKSLGGPPGGLLLTNDEELARRVEAIAFPGLTANFDVSKSAALAVTFLDWIEFGREYAAKMVSTCGEYAPELPDLSHQLAIEANAFDGGQKMARALREANLLTCGIGLPNPPVAGDLNGLRLGTPECVRWGMGPDEMGLLAGWIADALKGRRPSSAIGAEVTELKTAFGRLHFIRDRRQATAHA